MNACRLGVVLVALFLLPAAARAEENRVAHVLIVADTVDEKVGRLTKEDALMMYHLIKNSIPRDRLALRVLAGNQATPRHIADYYKNLRVDRRDAVVLFYSGHGGWDRDKGHLLTLNAGDVVRKNLVKVMTDKGGRLTVLLTNCCSNWVSIPAFGRDEDSSGSVRLGGLSPTLRCLLFQHQGLVDVTAAKQGTSAYGDREGGWFTIALARVLQASPQTLDLNKDGFVSWDEVFRWVRSETKAIFADRASAKLRRAQDTQEAISLSLGRRLAGTLERIPKETVEESTDSKYAGVTIRNPTSATIVYGFRWGTTGAMRVFKLPPNCYIRHGCKMDEDRTVPTPQIFYFRGFQGDPIKDSDLFNLKCSEIDRGNRRDLGKRYNFLLGKEDDRRVVCLTDPDGNDDD